MLGPLVALIGILGVARAATAGNIAPEPPLQAAARTLLGADQGVLAEAVDGTVLAAQAADLPVHPASVTKVATALALLERLGPDHRFETRVLAGGDVRDGQVAGDLVVEASGDPTLVYENAFLLLRRLRALGVRAVAGGLAVRGGLLFNWRPDPAGAMLRLALSGQDGDPAWAAVAAYGPPGAAGRLADAALPFAGVPVSNGASPRLLAVHRSPPLVRIVKWLNSYSNNVFHPLSDRVGGPLAVEAAARAHLPAAAREQVIIDNAAGAGETNRLSPRAVVAILRALDRELARWRLSPADVLPVSGIDPGTLKDRLLDRRGMIVGKTGTYGDVGACGLAGVVRTRRWGTVTFAIMNSWIPAPEARQRQDAFVRALLDAGEGLPWRYRPRTAPAFTEARVE